MTDENTPRDEDLTPDAPVEEAVEAEAEEAQAAAEEEIFEGGDLLDEEAMQAQLEEAMAEAQHEGLVARASWSLVHKELLILLFANCLFFAGVLAAWDRHGPWDQELAEAAALEIVNDAQAEFNRAEKAQLDNPTDVNAFVREQAMMRLDQASREMQRVKTPPVMSFNGLDTVRGSLIFVFAIFGFFMIVYCIRFRQVVVWPFLLNALFALWIGIPGFTNTIGGARWDAANDFMERQTASILEKLMAPLSTVPPGHWMLTAGGALVLIVLLKGVLSGMSAAKAKQAEARSSRRRR